jgi:hypothetical protein
MQTLTQLMTQTLAIGGLAAMCVGCEGLVGSMIIADSMDQQTAQMKRRNDLIEKQNHTVESETVPRGSGKTRYSFAFEYEEELHGTPDVREVDEFRNKLSAISLSGDDGINFASLIENQKGKYASVKLYQNSESQPDITGNERYLSGNSKIMTARFTTRDLIDHGIKPGRVTIAFKVRNAEDKDNNTWKNAECVDRYYFTFKE